MASDDLVYGFLLFLSIPFGLVIRFVPSPRFKDGLCAATGFAIITVICKEHTIHSIVVTLVNTIIILTASQYRYLHVCSFVWCFSYLTFFRTCHWYGIPKPSPHSNAVQLIITLKLIGVATEVFETEKLKQLSFAGKIKDASHNDALLKLKYKGIKYTWSRLISYSFCYIGALTGPFYTCRTYQDMLQDSHVMSLPLWSNFKDRLKPFPVCAAIFLSMPWFVTVQNVREPLFFEESSFLYRWMYLILLFAWLRSRFYCAWILAECMAVTAGLGAYPAAAVNKPGAGPTDLQAHDDIKKEESQIVYDFETIHNIMPYEIETATTIRTSLKTWNMTVQWWLVAHIYKNIPIRNKLIRNTILMSISAFWHGIHPGYYATFISAPFMLLAEDGMRRGIRDRLQTDNAKAIYDKIASFVRMRYFEYYSVGVFFLYSEEIWQYWSSLYFFGQYSLMGIIVIGQLLSLIPKSNHEQKID